MKTNAFIKMCLIASLVAIMSCTQVAFAQTVNSDTSQKQEVKSRKMIVAVPDGSDSYKVVLSDKTIFDIVSRVTDDFKGWTPEQKIIERVKPPILHQDENSKEWELRLVGISKTGQEVVAIMYLTLDGKNLVGSVHTRS